MATWVLLAMSDSRQHGLEVGLHLCQEAVGGQAVLHVLKVGFLRQSASGGWETTMGKPVGQHGENMGKPDISESLLKHSGADDFWCRSKCLARLIMLNVSWTSYLSNIAVISFH